MSKDKPLTKEQIEAIKRGTIGMDTDPSDAASDASGYDAQEEQPSSDDTQQGQRSDNQDAGMSSDAGEERDQKRDEIIQALRSHYDASAGPEVPAEGPGDEAYSVGYRKPPKHSQFKPGETGNRKGRPRKSTGQHLRRGSLSQFGDEGPDLTPSQKLLLSEGKRMIALKEHGQMNHISAERAAARSRFAEAIKGKPLAQSTLYRDQKEAEAAQRDRRAILNTFWREYSKQAWKVIEAIEAGQSDEPEPVPHPADIILSDEHDPQFCGPFTQEEWKETESHKSLREHLYLEHLYCERYGRVGPGEDERFPAQLAAKGLDTSVYNTGLITGAWFAIELLQQKMPPRLRWTHTDHMMADWQLNRGTRRDLEKRLTASRKTHGIHLPRGCFYQSAAFELSLHQFTIEAADYLIELFDRAKQDAALRGTPERAVEPPIGDPYELLAMMEAHGLTHERLISSTLDRRRKAA